MSLAVVRCPACRGASRVPIDALGQMVGCPRCDAPFVAAEDAPVAPMPSRAKSSPAPSAARRPAAVVPIAPPRRQRSAPSYEEEPEPLPDYSSSTATEVPDPEHDPHLPPVAGLPVTVLVGFALVPFGIPLLWFIGPMITGQEAALSLAVPISLAFAAAALCLGVVYTIDWTASTRIKGVLMLVGMSYFAGAGLYFLKKDMMDRVQNFFGKASGWNWVRSRDGNFSVKMPGTAWSVQERPLPDVEMIDGRRAAAQTDGQGVYNYLVAASKPMQRPANPDDEWFDKVGEQLKDAAGGQPRKVTQMPYTDTTGTNHPGRQWEFNLRDDVVRIVRVYVIKGRVYYLSAEGPNLDPGDEEFATQFFRSFGPFQQK